MRVLLVNFRILLLDEVIFVFDYNFEVLIMSNMDEICCGCIVISIVYCFNIICYVDNIFVLDKG